MKRPLCNGCKNRPKTIDNDVKEKYKTSPGYAFWGKFKDAKAG
jgi:hypothetical protein